MKFSDVIIAAAFLFVVSYLLDSFLIVPLIPLKNYTDLVAGVISGLIISIMVGYLFASQIREESRPRAIGSIVLLGAVGAFILDVAWISSPLTSPFLKDEIQSMFSTAGWTDYQWYSYTAFVIALEVLVFLVVNFAGLYLGSMLKPKKT